VSSAFECNVRSRSIPATTSFSNVRDGQPVTVPARVQLYYRQQDGRWMIVTITIESSSAASIAMHPAVNGGEPATAGSKY